MAFRNRLSNKVTVPYIIRFEDIEPFMSEDTAETLRELVSTIKVFVTVKSHPADPQVGIREPYTEIYDWDRDRYDENLSLFEDDLDDAISQFVFDNDEILSSRVVVDALDTSYYEDMLVDEYIERRQLSCAN